MFKKVFSTILILLAFIKFSLPGLMAQETQADKEFFFAQKLYQDKLYNLAAEQFKEFSRKFSSNEKADDALYLSGQANFANSEYQKAFDSYKELEINYPQSNFLPDARFRLAECQAAMQNFANAAELFKRVPVFHKESDKAATAFFESAKSFLQIEDSKSALAVLFELISTYPDSPERVDAHLKIVEIYLDRGDYTEALTQTENLFRTFGPDLKDPRIYLLRAEVFEKLGQFEEALEIYTTIVQEFQTSKEAQRVLYHLGSLFQTQGDLDKALTYYDQYLVNFKDSELTPKVYLRKGDIYFSKQQFEQALENYQKAEQSASTKLQDEVDYKIAAVFDLQGKYQLAEARLQRVIKNATNSKRENKSSPFLEGSYFKLTEVFIKSGQPQKALQNIAEYKKRFAESSKQKKIKFMEAELFEKQLKDYPRALRAYQNYLDQFPRSRRVDEAQAGIARCYEKLSDYLLALKEYQNYLQRYPAGDDFEWVKNRVRLISETINIENGLYHVSGLLSKFAETRDSGNWNVELAKFYFQIKDFSRAIKAFKKILSESGNGLDRAEVVYYLGLSYSKMADKSALKNDFQKSAAYLDSSAVLLGQIVENYSDFDKLEDVEFVIVKMELDTLFSVEKKQTRLLELHALWQEKFPEGKYLDFILIQLADSYLEKAVNDSVSAAAALNYYKEIQENYTKSPYFEKANFRTAAALSYLGQDSTSLADLTAFLKTYPKSELIPAGLLLKSKLHKKFGNIEAAIKDLQRVESEYFYSPLAVQAQLELANTRFENGDYQSVLDIYRELKKNSPEFSGKNGLAFDKSIGLREARAYENLGEDSKALERYVLFARQNPGHKNLDEALLGVARIARKQEKLVFAKEYYQNILKHSSQVHYKLEARLALGDILFKEGLNDDARTHYISASQFAGNLEQEKYPASQAVRCLIKQKKFADANLAIKAFKKKYKDTKDEEAQFLLEKANIYLATKNFELAEEAFKKLKKDNKNTEFAARGEFGLGAVYLISKHTEDALKILTAIPAKYPDSEVAVLTYFNLGDFYYKSQQIENAISAFKQVLKHPKAGGYYPKALLYLIQCYNDSHFWDQAIIATRDYLDKYPFSKQSFRKKIDLAQTLLNLKEYNRAIEHFQKLLPFSDEQTEAEIQFYIGQCYREMGNFERASAEYLKVKYLTKPSKLPWHVTALFEAGRCLLKIKETEPAKTVFKRIIKEQGSESNFGRFAQKQLDDLEKKNISLTSKNDTGN
ncbi:tetratricopeptide repeat protein [candidate division KSB1 bacterium]|nr:tetratricopeptide repeat protein [candidate division KSB1 bacterium]